MKAILSPTTWAVMGAIVAVLVALHLWRVDAARSQGYAQGEEVGAARVQLQFDAYKESMRASMQRELARAIQSGIDIQAKAEQREEQFHEQKRALESTVAELAERLRQREPRPAGSAGSGGAVPRPASPASPAGEPAPILREQDGEVPCRATGAGLYREDALWLLEEARRADELRAAYHRDRAAYEDAAAELRRLNEQAQKRLLVGPAAE